MKFTKSYLNSHYITVAVPAKRRQSRPLGDGVPTSSTDRLPKSSPLQPLRKADDRTAKPDVFLKCKPRTTHQELLDNTHATYFANEPLSNVFGPLNEHEFSSSVWFKNPKLKHAVYLEDGRNAVQTMDRHSYEEACTIFYDSDKISTKYFENCSEFNTKLIVRVDSHDDGEVRSTVKLRVCRSKFNWNDITTVVLSRAIELPMLGWNISDIRPPKEGSLPLVKPTKSRKTVFWYVTLKCDSRTYPFRVAFRHSADPHKHVECNIECEEPIDGHLYGEMFYAIYKYYFYQFEVQDGEIDPVVRNYALFQESLHYTSDLTQDQRQMIDTLNLVVCPTGGWTEEASVDEAIAEFVTYLGIYTYVNFYKRQTEESGDSAANVEYDKSFKHLQIYESNEGVIQQNLCESDDSVLLPDHEVFGDS